MILGVAAAAVLAWVWRTEFTREPRAPAAGPDQASAQTAPAEAATPPPLPEALVKSHERWQMPTEEALAKASPASEEERQEVLKRLRALLNDEWAPTETDVAGLRDFPVASDPAEALKANFVCVAYERGETVLSVKSFLGFVVVIVQPAPQTIDPLVVQLADKARAMSGSSHQLAAQPEELNALMSLWRTYLAVPPPSLDRAQPGPRGQLGRERYGVGLQAWTIRINGLDGLCGAEMWTDGRLVVLTLLLESVYDNTLRKVWGRTVADAGVTPLNPDSVTLQLTDRWLDTKGNPTTTAAHATSRLVRVMPKGQARPSSTYAEGVQSLRESGAYWVAAPGGQVAEDTWRLCEFDALATRALQTARATLWNGDLVRDLQSPQTRTQAAIGMRALHADYDAVCRSYAGVVTPAAAREVDDRVRAALDSGAWAWGEVAKEWDRLLEANPNGPPEEYVAQLMALKDRLTQEHSSLWDVRRAIESARKQVMEYSGAHGVSRTIEME